jgi:hypothetical protein
MPKGNFSMWLAPATVVASSHMFIILKTYDTHFIKNQLKCKNNLRSKNDDFMRHNLLC